MKEICISGASFPYLKLLVEIPISISGNGNPHLIQEKIAPISIFRKAYFHTQKSQFPFLEITISRLGNPSPDHPQRYDLETKLNGVIHDIKSLIEAVNDRRIYGNVISINEFTISVYGRNTK